MKILIYGAGVIGTLYAVRLEKAGHEVTVLARGARLREIEEHGLIVEDAITGDRSSARVAMVNLLGAGDAYDLALITVRHENLPEVLPTLEANQKIPMVVFLLNNPHGSEGLADGVGLDRVLLGFPGAGGVLENHIVRYVLIPQQPTTVGEPRGVHTGRPKALAEWMRAAGFAARVDSDMDGWLMAHAFFVTSVCAAIYMAGGDAKSLSANRAALELMVGGVREGFRAVRAMGRAVHPIPLKVLFLHLPRRFAVNYWRGFFRDDMAELVFAEHARHAAGEMRALAEECRLLLTRSGVEGAAIRKLYEAIDERAAYPAGGQQGPARIG